MTAAPTPPAGKGENPFELEGLLKDVAAAVLGGAGTALGQAFLLDKLGYGSLQNNILEDQFPGTNPWERLGAGAGAGTTGVNPGQAAAGFSTLLETLIQARAAVTDPRLTPQEQERVYDGLRTGVTGDGLRSAVGLELSKQVAADAGLSNADAYLALAEANRVDKLVDAEKSHLEAQAENAWSQVDFHLAQGDLESAKAEMAKMFADASLMREQFGGLAPAINVIQGLSDVELDKALMALAAAALAFPALRSLSASIRFIAGHVRNAKVNKMVNDFFKKGPKQTEMNFDTKVNQSGSSYKDL